MSNAKKTKPLELKFLRAFLWLFVNCSGQTSGEDDRRSLHFYIQSDKNTFFTDFKVPKTKGNSFDKFDEIISLEHFTKSDHSTRIFWIIYLFQMLYRKISI